MHNRNIIRYQVNNRRSNLNLLFLLRWQVQSIRFPLLSRVADFDVAAPRGRPHHLHQQRPVLRNHPGVRPWPREAIKEPNRQGKTACALFNVFMFNPPPGTKYERLITSLRYPSFIFGLTFWKFITALPESLTQLVAPLHTVSIHANLMR